MKKGIQLLLLCLINFTIFKSARCQDTIFCGNARPPSQYEQYCCPDNNKGKTFIITGETKKYFLCPLQTPNSCSNLTFSSSCYDIFTNYPDSTSGYYNIELTNGSTINVYCDMEGVNCDGEGGWMRLAYLNMSDPTEQCPSGFRLYEESDIRACGRQSGPGCQSVIFPSYSISYSWSIALLK